jgi:hypothetical protein
LEREREGWRKHSSLTCPYIINETTEFGNHGEREGETKASFFSLVFCNIRLEENANHIQDPQRGTNEAASRRF